MTSRGKRTAQRRHHQRHHQRQLGEQPFATQVVTSKSNIKYPAIADERLLRFLYDIIFHPIHLVVKYSTPSKHHQREQGEEPFPTKVVPCWSNIKHPATADERLLRFLYDIISHTPVGCSLYFVVDFEHN